MKKTVCDRCGKMFEGYPFSNVVLPYYEIKRCDLFVRDVDLCRDCQREFKEWLRNGDVTSLMNSKSAENEYYKQMASQRKPVSNKENYDDSH